MAGIITRINALDEAQRKFLVDNILKVPELKGTFYRLLTTSGPDDQEAFYKGLPDGLSAAMQQQAPAAAGMFTDGGKKAETAIARRITTLRADMARLEKDNVAARRLTLKYRELMKSCFGKLDKLTPDQARGLPRGPLQKPCPEGAELVALPKPDRSVLKKANIFDCIEQRVSRRRFADSPLSLAELSYLLWATQGVRKMPNPAITLRNVPSGGSMHPLETYLAVYNVTGLKKGLYNYQALDHKLLLLSSPADLAERVIKAARNKPFMGHCAAAFIWSAVPYRTEWRYMLESKKLIMQDVGHVCQNLYLACESINCGTCAVGAYDQDLADGLLGLDGRNELVVYMAPAGRALP